MDSAINGQGRSYDSVYDEFLDIIPLLPMLHWADVVMLFQLEELEEPPVVSKLA